MNQPVNESTVEELKEIVGDALDEIIDAYVTDGKELIETMGSALSAQDFARLQAISHQLKASSANVGALGISELMKKIEAFARDGNLEGITPLFSSAESEFSRVIEYFRPLTGNAA